MTEPFGTDATTAGADPPDGATAAGEASPRAGAGSAVPQASDAVGDGAAEAAERDVAAALAELDAASASPPAEQIPAYTKVHQTLQATLARIDDD